MKRIIAFILCLAAVLSLAACGDGGSVESHRDDDGNLITESDRRRVVSVDSLPYSVPYNSKAITLKSVDSYELYADGSHSYHLYSVITIDISELTEEEVSWLRGEDLDVRAFITSEKNGEDFGLMSSLGSIRWTDAKEIQFVKTSSFSNSYRYSFSGAEICVSMAVSQTGDKEQEVMYSAVLPGDLPDAGTIPEPLYGYVVTWLNEKAEK